MLGKKIVIIILVFLIVIIAVKIKFQSHENFSNKELKFIHITKNAGTFIEDIAKRKNILFGRFHGEYGFWHHFFPNVDENIKNKYDWFMVVRNPYDRIISEYYCNWNGVGDTIHNKKEFNEEINIKVRSTGRLLKAKVNLLENSADVEILDQETGISPGQACVFYSKDEIGDKVLGGGWIHKTFNKNLSTKLTT